MRGPGRYAEVRRPGPPPRIPLDPGRTTPPEVRSRHVSGVCGPEGFAALGVAETLVHTHDLAERLGLEWYGLLDDVRHRVVGVALGVAAEEGHTSAARPGPDGRRAVPPGVTDETISCSVPVARLAPGREQTVKDALLDARDRLTLATRRL